jgi:uncharacterized membrane protein
MPYCDSGRGRLLLLPLTCAALLAGCSDNGTEPSATTTETPRIDFVHAFYAVGVTPDGSRAAFESDAGDLYLYDTRTGSLELKTYVGDLASTVATGMSATGAVTALHGNPVQPAFWTEHSDWTPLVSPFKQGCFSGYGEDTGGAWDVSADGNVIVGLLWNGCSAQAFRWDAAGSGMVTPLELLGENFPGSTSPPSNRATKVSRDGQIAGGFAQTAQVDRWPAFWRADGSGTMLTGGPADTPGEVMAINSDGTVLAGYWGTDGFYWTADVGTVMIGKLPDADPYADNTYVNAIGAEGKLLFGTCGNVWFGNPPRAFVWTHAAGMRPLMDVVAAAGVTIPEGISLTNVMASSSDGQVIVGTATDGSNGAPFPRPVTFVLHLPHSAYGL